MTTRSSASPRLRRYYHYPAFWEGGAELSFFINKATWDALPKQFQKVVRIAAMATGHDMQAKYDVLNPPALKRLIAAGAQLKPMPTDVLRASYKATHDLFKESSEKHPSFKTIYDHQIGVPSREPAVVGHLGPDLRLQPDHRDAAEVGERLIDLLAAVSIFAQPPVTLMWRATAGFFERRSMMKSWPLGLREIASSMARDNSASSLDARSTPRRSAASSWPRHM